MPNFRVVISGLAVGTLAAAMFGVNLSSSSDPAGNVTTSVSPSFALFGFLLGSAVGYVIGDLWNRTGVAGVVGSILVVLVFAAAGTEVAALAGAETRVTVTETSIEMIHGAPGPVLLAGAIAGVIIGAVVAWRFGRFRKLAVAT